MTQLIFEKNSSHIKIYFFEISSYDYKIGSLVDHNILIRQVHNIMLEL
jgi:hypothetical protein